MTGSEVRKVLQENRINFAWLAKELGISPQGLNSRLLAKEFRQSYLLELNQVLGKPLFEVPTAINEYRLPVYQIQISAGYGMPLDEGKESVTEYVQIPNLKGCIGVTVFGDSMYPLYYPSDIVFVRRVMDKQDINYGSAYVIITTSERLLKLLYPSTRGDEYIRLCSYNAALKPDGERLYPDRTLPLDNIIYLYKVVGTLRRDQI